MDKWGRRRSLEPVLVLGQYDGSSGTYTLTGGTLNVKYATIIGAEGNGVFNLGTGTPGDPTTYEGDGTHTTGELNVGYQTTGSNKGVYNLYSGTLNVEGDWGNGTLGSTVIGGGNYGPIGTGEFNQYGGTHNTRSLFLGDTPGSTGTYNLFGGDLVVGTFIGIGSMGTGIFNQSGGTHTTGTLVLGQYAGSIGTYNFTGGILNDSAIIGDAGTGVFKNSGGTHNVTGDLIIGYQSTGNGTYNLQSGMLTVNGNEIIGLGGIGIFIQSGGTHTVKQDLTITKDLGTYNKTGGVLNVLGGIINNGTFNYTGGTVTTSLIMNYGTFVGDGASFVGNFRNLGTVSPGSSPGTLTITGDYTQDSLGILLIELAGFTQGTEYDFLNITGNATLSGKLDVDLLNGFNPDMAVSSISSMQMEN